MSLLKNQHLQKAGHSTFFKLMALVIVSILIITNFIGIVSYEIAKSQLIDSGKRNLKDITESAYSLITYLDKEVKSGNLTLEEAQSKAKDALVGEIIPNKDPHDKTIIRDYKKVPYVYKTEGYMFGYNSNYLNVFHPMGTEGENLKDKQDADGNYVTRDLVKTSKKPNPEDRYMTYMWINPDEKSPREKIAYLTYFKDWDWMIGVGAYTAEFYDDLNVLKHKIIIFSIISLIITSALFYFLIKKQVNIINDIKNNMQEVSNGNFNIKPLSVRTNTDIGNLANSFDDMVISIKARINDKKESSDSDTPSSDEISVNEERNKKLLD